APTYLADTLWREGMGLMRPTLGEGPFRLIGVGLSELTEAEEPGFSPDLLDPGAESRAKAEAAMDKLRARFGAEAVIKGRSLR
ncbi:MAG: DNA polymerase IV, partial [Roseinatronobacter sp.]